MALLWRVSTAQRQPLLMKVPIMAYSEGPGAIVGFEVEQMILPRLIGPARSALRRLARFLAPTLHRDGAPAGAFPFPVFESAPLDAGPSPTSARGSRRRCTICIGSM